MSKIPMHTHKIKINMVLDPTSSCLSDIGLQFVQSQSQEAEDIECHFITGHAYGHTYGHAYRHAYGHGNSPHSISSNCRGKQGRNIQPLHNTGGERLPFWSNMAFLFQQIHITLRIVGVRVATIRKWAMSIDSGIMFILHSCRQHAGDATQKLTHKGEYSSREEITRFWFCAQWTLKRLN